MAEIPQYTYAQSEHYEFPRTPSQQADEELRLYPKPRDFRKSLVMLKELYKETPCFSAMKRYAEFASVVKAPAEHEEYTSGFNRDFFSGALIAMHVNVAPTDDYTKWKVLTTDFLDGLDSAPNRETIIDSIQEWLKTWAGEGENSWQEFFDSQDKDYQDHALALCAHMFDGFTNNEERQQNFMLGYTLSSNLVWTAGMSAQIRPPV
jgi:hypothetical protein